MDVIFPVLLISTFLLVGNLYKAHRNAMGPGQNTVDCNKV